jgi:hypothetical protein
MKNLFSPSYFIFVTAIFMLSCHDLHKWIFFVILFLLLHDVDHCIVLLMDYLFFTANLF